MQAQPAPDSSLYVAKTTLSPWFAITGIGFCGLFCIWKLAAVGKVIVPLIAFALIVVLLVKRSQEQQRIARQKIATGIVLTWKMDNDSENGKTWIVTYQFTVDGKNYEGKGSSHSELPKEGGTLPISYELEKPGDNMPLASYWFFRFEERS